MILRKIGKVIKRIQRWIQREKVWKTVRYQYLISPFVAIFFGLVTAIIDVQGYSPEGLFADDENLITVSDDETVILHLSTEMVYVVTKPIVTTLVQTTSTTTTTTTTVGTTTVKVTTTTEAVEEESEVEYVVYKPGTKYVHRSTCYWVDDTCYEISSTEDIEARLCDECWPDIEIINEYVEPSDESDYGSTTNFDGTSLTSLLYISDEERIMLAKLVQGEAGADWLSIYDKACPVACVWNRYCDGGWQDKGAENTVRNVIIASGQFYGYSPDNPTPQSCLDAVEYFFENMEIFPHYLKFNGDGTYNYFY